MANYDRRILVPYLRDVCSVEMLCAKLEREITNVSNRIGNLNYQVNQQIRDPAYPVWEDYSKGCYEHLGGVIIGAIIVLAGWWMIKVLGWLELFIPIGIVAILYGGLLIWTCVSDILERRRSAEHNFNVAVDRYYQIKKENEAARNRMSQYYTSLADNQRYLSALRNRLSAAQNLRNEVYSVNIISSRYRNKYAAYYLYDYFYSSRETDLDKIIQTMLLDEIKQRLDKIIMQNEEILLNQRVQMAMQEQQNWAIAENHHEQMRQIASMERNQELQMDYQRMIARNQEVTNFFLAADYLRKN